MLCPTMPARQKTLGVVPERAWTSMLPTPQNSPSPPSTTLRMPTAAPRVARSSLWQRITIGSTAEVDVGADDLDGLLGGDPGFVAVAEPVDHRGEEACPRARPTTKLSPQTVRPLKGRLNPPDFIVLLGTGR